jgi:hypothetical protein
MNIHHVGYVVKSIEKFEKHLMFDEKIVSVVDDIQKAKLSLYKADNIYLELIEPLSEDAFTYASLHKNGDHYHHLCYEVRDEAAANEIIKTRRMIKVLGPVYALLFDLDVMFAINKNKQIVEFLLCQK